MDYFVGLDFGHGETAAWYIPISDGENISDKGAPLRIKRANEPGGMKFPSRIYKFPDGSYSVIGGPHEKIITKFKKKVSDLNQDAEKREGYIQFIKDVVKRIKDNNQAILNPDGTPNFYLCIACPTKWSVRDAEEYLAFFNTALSELNIQVHWVINESDAAYFTHRSDKETVLVIDYGSSTIDYTLISKGTKIDIDDVSNQTLGASKIEGAMLEYIRRKKGSQYQEWVQHCYHILHSQEPPENSFDVVSELEYSLREAKEKGYTEFVGYENRPYDFILDFDPADKTGIDDMPGIKHRDFFDNILGGYYSEVERDFERLNSVVKQRLPQNSSIDKIILSGGACIMPWVRKKIQDIFKIDSSCITDDPNPEYVVAQGITLYAKAQKKALLDLERMISDNNFEDIYKQADNKATQIALKKLLPKKLEEIKISTDLSGNEILDIIIPFFEHFDCSDPDYRSIMQEQMNILLSESISKAVSDAVKRGFGKILDEEEKDSIKVTIPIANFFWKEGSFSRGARYNTLKQVIASCKGNFTNWVKKRELYRRKVIAEKILSYYSRIGAFEITYDEDSLRRMGLNLKTAALNEAKKIFYQKELFKTTFMP